MRSLEECKAEIFRRSEEKIKKKKRNRGRILALGIPLCLIAVLWSVLILPAMLPAKSEDRGGGDPLEHDAPFLCLRVVTKTPEGEFSLTEEGTAQKAYEKTLSLMEKSLPAEDTDNKKSESVLENPENFASDPVAGQFGALSQIRMDFYSEGRRKTYLLSDRSLSDSEGKTVLLTPEELAELKLALGIAP